MDIMIRDQDTDIPVFQMPDDLLDILFIETTTLGARVRMTGREVLEREIVTVSSEWGEMPVKLGKRNGRIVTAAPEFEACRRVAEATGTPLKRVYEAILMIYRSKQ